MVGKKGMLKKLATGLPDGSHRDASKYLKVYLTISHRRSQIVYICGILDRHCTCLESDLCTSAGTK